VDPEHRFFLALLLNVSTRTDLLALVEQSFPEAPPVETILRWAEGAYAGNGIWILLFGLRAARRFACGDMTNNPECCSLFFESI
jgi:hypothetical protein